MNDLFLRIAGIAEESIVDGPGFRFTVFTQGCPHHCPGCHNGHTWDYKGGDLVLTDDLLAKIDGNPLLDGVTFSGGEPFEQCRILPQLAHEIKARGLNLWVYSGYTFEQIVANRYHCELLKYADVLVDGRFEQDKKDMLLQFRGSSNQRIIDVQRSLALENGGIIYVGL